MTQAPAERSAGACLRVRWNVGSVASRAVTWHWAVWDGGSGSHDPYGIAFALTRGRGSVRSAAVGCSAVLGDTPVQMKTPTGSRPIARRHAASCPA